MSNRTSAPLAAMALAGLVVSGTGRAVTPGPAAAAAEPVSRIDSSSPVRDRSIPPGASPDSSPVPVRKEAADGKGNAAGGVESAAPKGKGSGNSRPVVQPEAMPRCTAMPTAPYWETRRSDVLASIKRMARTGLIPALRLPDVVTTVRGVAQHPAGWSAYSIAVPGKKTVRVSLEHPNLGWFRIGMMDKEGLPEKGMVQNLVQTGRTEVSFVNPLDEVKVVFVLVDDPGWLSTEEAPFVMSIARDWKPAGAGPGGPRRSYGVWASLDPIAPKDEAKPN